MTTAARASRAPAVPPDDVRAALARLLASDVVGGSRRTSDFLAYTVGEVLAGRGGRIRERTVAAGALGRGPRFDPRVDPCVRVQARRVRVALERYYAGPGARDPVRIELPRGGYAPVFRSTDPPAPPAPAATPTTGVAVASLVNLTPGGELDHLAPGISETLVAAVSGLPGFRVIGPISPVPAGPAALAALGARHGVRFVLTGTTRARGTAVRTSVRLVETVGGVTLWSLLFDGRLDADAPFAMEDGIASEVVLAVAAHRAATAV